jgi:hypothetical protein
MQKTGILIFSIFLLLLSCGHEKEKHTDIPIVNLDHLMHLYNEIQLTDGGTAGVINIYSEYPNYDFEIEPNEGFTCVDDVARAMLIDAVRYSSDKSMQAKYDNMARFLLYMQAENTWFHNFIWHDLSINTTYRTSLAEPNWWSWRAFWALSNFNSTDLQLNGKTRQACNRLIENVFQLFLKKQQLTDSINGLVVPTWLPQDVAGDQAAVLILGLEAYYKNIKQDKRALLLIEKLADGLLLTQKGDAFTFPFGAFLSWQNMWHAYGNSQAYAMLKAGRLLKRQEYIESALLEIDHFYPYLINENFLAFFSLKKTDDRYEETERKAFAQIAYGFRPAIWACTEAFKLTGKEKYLRTAEQLIQWFSGGNVANRQMYDPATGRCYDGIVSETEVNKNSGAESTIEALLSLQAFSKTVKK